MSQVRVGVLGYGVIGKRVADAVRVQPDMELAGVAGLPNSASLELAAHLGYPIYLAAPASTGDLSERLTNHGMLDDLLSQCDVLLDCTPSGGPAKYAAAYERHPHLTVIVQGGEKHSFGDVSFNAFANYGEARGRKRIRVISCSSTGVTRLVYTLHSAFDLSSAFITLFRRAADPGKRSKTPINALTPVLGQSHHAPDVKTVLPDLDLYSMSLDCCTTLGHVLNFQADIRRGATSEEVLHVLTRTPRIVVGRGLASTADLAEFYQDLGRPRRDRPELYVWGEGIHVEGRTIYATASVHMESITIPETIDCIRAALGLETDPWTSILRTDQALGILRGDAVYRPPSVGDAL